MKGTLAGILASTYSNPLVLLATLLLNLTRPITCTGQSPRWVSNEQERRLFLPGILMRQEKETGSLCQPVICLPVASWLAWATCSSSALARALAGCRLGPPGTKGSHLARRKSQGCQGLGLLHRYSGRKAGWKQGTAPSTWKTASLFSGTRKHCTQPTHRTALEPSLQQEKNAGFGVLPSIAVAGAEEQRELQAPTMAHCAMHNKHLASCAVICGQTLALAATELGKGQRVKDKPWEQKQS